MFGLNGGGYGQQAFSSQHPWQPEPGSCSPKWEVHEGPQIPPSPSPHIGTKKLDSLAGKRGGEKIVDCVKASCCVEPTGKSASVAKGKIR